MALTPQEEAELELAHLAKCVSAGEEIAMLAAEGLKDEYNVLATCALYRSAIVIVQRKDQNRAQRVIIKTFGDPHVWGQERTVETVLAGEGAYMYAEGDRYGPRITIGGV